MNSSVADRLKLRSPEILKRWQARAYIEVAAALYQNAPALKDSLPEYLDSLATALSDTAGKQEIRWARKESSRAGKQHGRDRVTARNYTLDQLILEYRILRQVICEALTEEEPLTERQREIIVCSIEQAVSDAATEFSDALRDIQEIFSSTIAHDLRMPLAGARLNAEVIVAHASEAGTCLKAGKQIYRSMDRIDSMIHDLLDASRLRAGEVLPLEMADCDLDELLREVVGDLNEAADARFEYLSAGPVPGRWNRDGLRRLIENLSSNAVKYGATESRVTWSLSQDAASTTLTIHNQGKPIPQEEQDILFQQYRRARSSEGQVGWGLGLTVVKGITEAHGGKVRVESAEGRGTRFVVTLPKTLP